MSRMVWPKIRQTEKARIFDGTALSLVYPGAIPTPLLPLIGWIFEKVVDSINGSRGETELCSFVYFIYVTICLVYVKKKESKNQFFLFWGTSSCRSRSGFVRCNESVATDTSLVLAVASFNRWTDEWLGALRRNSFTNTRERRYIIIKACNTAICIVVGRCIHAVGSFANYVKPLVFMYV